MEKVGGRPVPIIESQLANEQLLEEMIVAAPRILSDDWMLIGRQEDTGFGGRIDLLAVAADGSLVLIELKAAERPREVVAKALEYAGWVEKLRSDEIAAIYGRFAPGRSLAEDFHQRFGQALDEDSLNSGHQVVIVAGSLDESTERIVSYLADRDVPINILCFQVFSDGADQFLSRAWLLDPARVQLNVSTALDGAAEPWNGEFYCNYGHGENRSWEDAVQYGFICAGGGSFYTRTLQLLNPSDRVWVKAPGYGFVGVGRVIGRSQPAASFKVTTPIGDQPVLEVAKGGKYHAAVRGRSGAVRVFCAYRLASNRPVGQRCP